MISVNGFDTMEHAIEFIRFFESAKKNAGKYLTRQWDEGVQAYRVFDNRYPGQTIGYEFS